MSTDFIFKQQENLVDNQKCQAEFSNYATKYYCSFGDNHVSTFWLFPTSNINSSWHCFCCEVGTIDDGLGNMSLDHFLHFCFNSWNFMLFIILRHFVFFYFSSSNKHCNHSQKSSQLAFTSKSLHLKMNFIKMGTSWLIRQYIFRE